MAKIYTTGSPRQTNKVFAVGCSQAPLPFMGQKRRWNKDFKAALLKDFGDCHTFVDLFGGSGLLSHFTHTVRPDATIIYNDYDGYVQRLSAIPTTNRLLAELRTILATCRDNKRIVEPQRTQILTLLQQAENNGEQVDYISLSNSILFSGKYATNYDEMTKQTFYNRIRSIDFQADDYLTGIDIVHCDYRQLVAQYKGIEGVCFIADPPYLSTQATPYKGYWRLSDYLDVLSALKGSNYIYFTSTKSSLIELCDWLEKEGSTALNPMHGAQRLDKYENLNYSATYTEVMLYKHQPQNARRNAA